MKKIDSTSKFEDADYMTKIYLPYAKLIKMAVKYGVI
ncbi:MAG: hypothetical protein DNFNHJIP_00602 [Candidatus Argoarchaeum ethanivorans]|uniref:Uncharacterized protein n=1 Tax=Candidatus Argoarchaeum ethanivorans TaxID=2608793 RepID=A0A812A324_9EURY|nr:MAG: hypothetical protein DNFNHJIP_00602 [Candidatus Argoarchaeum ethanivorans]